MASTYNGSVANLVDPLANSPLTSPSHSGQHTEINDALQTLGVWTAYTPTWGASTTNPSIGNGTIAASYVQFNKTIFLRGAVKAGSTTTFGSGFYSVSWPSGLEPKEIVSGSNHRALTGSVMWNQPGVANWAGNLVTTSNPAQALPGFTFVFTSATAAMDVWTPTTPFTFANGNIMQFSVMYEIA